MAKIEYVHNEGNGSYCLCPNVTVAIPAFDVKYKVDAHYNQIKHKRVNEVITEVTEKVVIIINYNDNKCSKMKETTCLKNLPVFCDALFVLQML